MLFELTQGQKEELLNKKRGHSLSVMSILLDHSQKRVKKKKMKLQLVSQGPKSYRTEYYTIIQGGAKELYFLMKYSYSMLLRERQVENHVTILMM